MGDFLHVSFLRVKYDMKDRYIIAVLAVFLQIAVLVGCSGRESNSIEIASVNGEKFWPVI